jgi:predicted ATPase
LEALEAWAGGYFQLGENITIGEEGLSGPVLRVNGNRLIHLGTGVSQILPVIAISLWAKPSSTIILEQPELHLHPGLQQKLGTFLTLVASTGRQVIVETHSEYLLTRVRRHLAEKHISEETCTLVFVQDDGRVIQRPALSGGDLEEWPEQFLDHSLDDALAIASLRERAFDSE